mmetsp:Transcript_128/g.120  ORF Transcript_128/g.120 Transcript_128/m.120 type:complete len:82 (-) Transcript_128:102-347(-)
MGEFQYGYAIGILNFPNRLGCDYLFPDYDDKDKLIILYEISIAMMPVGATISSFLTGIISDYGRRRCLFIANIIFAIGTAT